MFRRSTRIITKSSIQRRFYNTSTYFPSPSPSRSYHADFTPVKPLSLPAGHHSLLPLVHSCNNLVLPSRSSLDQDNSDTNLPTISTRSPTGESIATEQVVPFHLSHTTDSHITNPTLTISRGPVGFLRPQVASALEDDHQKHQLSGAASPWDLRYAKSESQSILTSVAFADWVNDGGKYTRTMHVERIVGDWKKHGHFKEILRGWSDEAYPVFCHPPALSQSAHLYDPIAFAIERAALPLFGLANFGALLIAYVRDPSTGQTMIWIPRRSLMKRTWPGKLDVTVGGGMGLGDTPLSTILRESAEEALLDSDYVNEYIRPVGVLPFPNRSPGGWILPGLYHLFDLPLPLDGSIHPRINALDGEVEAFELLEVDEVLKRLLEGRFKSSSALAIVDFLIRHGFVTDETDPRYMEICRALKPDMPVPGMWRPHA
ncbi:hypothetical protein CVT24_009809 [Panaeolus cyanescens]|uniref:Nudix hydrolase domain-containing protein n=1 Tax=Panaeolus cyanescens TaxID=181874 RepID=A0A409VAC1_9AGAR|nr:hypothetical protein CVT24_009809 [Panaeolus cyanescens]